jgi:hypothetical protein
MESGSDECGPCSSSDNTKAWILVVAILASPLALYLLLPGFREFVLRCAYEGFVWTWDHVLS